MKLADAISLGATLRPQGTGTFYNAETHATCVMGGALEAAGVDVTTLNPGDLWRESERLWAWAYAGGYNKCPVEDYESISSVAGIITRLNDHPHCWTRERIAAWVAVVEPPDS